MTDITICKCGRRLDTPFPHCPNCGSTTVYSKQSAGRNVEVSGSKTWARGFKCRRCGLEYHELIPCEAPPQVPRSTATSLKMMLKPGFLEPGGLRDQIVADLRKKYKPKPNKAETTEDVHNMFENPNEADEEYLRQYAEQFGSQGEPEGEKANDKNQAGAQADEPVGGSQGDKVQDPEGGDRDHNRG